MNKNDPVTGVTLDLGANDHLCIIRRGHWPVDHHHQTYRMNASDDARMQRLINKNVLDVTYIWFASGFASFRATRIDLKPRQFFRVLEVSRADFAAQGYDASKVPDYILEHIAFRMSSQQIIEAFNLAIIEQAEAHKLPYIGEMCASCSKRTYITGKGCNNCGLDTEESDDAA